MQTPEHLVQTLFLNPEEPISIIDVSYTGDLRSIGVFYTNTKALPFQKGIVLSTGFADDIDGPNESDQTGIGLYKPGDKQLDGLVKNNTADASVLSFTFYPASNEVSFEYFFASEEYPEFVNKGVNDVFALFIKGPEYPEWKNLALIPRNNNVVSIDNVNALKNASFYVSNDRWKNDLVYTNPSGVELSYGFAFDGLTTLLTAKVEVTPFQGYTLKIAIADVGDNVYDSGVFLRANSLKNIGEYTASVTDFEKDADIVLDDSLWIDIKSDKDKLSLVANIQFDFDSYEILPENIEALSQLHELLSRYFISTVNIIGHTDAVGSTAYNMLLSKKRAQSIKEYLVSLGIESERLLVEGKGKQEPLFINPTTSEQKANRRVEFTIRL